jgi:Flp pilus assembly protein TadG
LCYSEVAIVASRYSGYFLIIPSTAISAGDAMQERNEMPTLNHKLAGKIAKLVRGKKNLAHDTEGGSLIEFAFILPCMMLLITGMAWFGIALNNYIVLTNAVGSGARALALSRGQTTPSVAGTDPCAYAVQTANAAAVNLNTEAITYTVDWTTYNASGTAVTTTYTNSCAGLSLSANDNVRFRAVYPFTALVYGWRPTRLNLTAQTAELVQ